MPINWPGSSFCPRQSWHASTHRGTIEVVQVSGAPLVSLRGADHSSNVRDPVRFNLSLLDFVDPIAA